MLSHLSGTTGNSYLSELVHPFHDGWHRGADRDVDELTHALDCFLIAELQVEAVLQAGVHKTIAFSTTWSMCVFIT